MQDGMEIREAYFQYDLLWLYVASAFLDSKTGTGPELWFPPPLVGIPSLWDLPSQTSGLQQKDSLLEGTKIYSNLLQKKI